MRSACRVRFPNRCDENIMVLLPLNFLRRSKRSISREVLVIPKLGMYCSAPCSAIGSKEALGSSNNSMPAEDSVSEAKERMNVRDLFKQSTLAPQFYLKQKIHCKSLHLPATET